MSAKEFDELIKSKLGEADFAYANEDYHAMNAQLLAAREGKSSRKMWLLLTGIAACMLIVIVISALSTNSSYNGQLASKEVIAKPMPSQTTNSPLTEQKQQEPEITNIATVTATKQTDRTPKQNIIPQRNGISGITYQKKATTQTVPNNKADSMPSNGVQKADINVFPIGNEAFLLSSLNAPPSHNVSGVSELEPLWKDYIKIDRSLNVSLAGGLNYGAASQGYLLGASVRKNLSNKLYVEGDLAYTNSNSQRTVNAYNTSMFVGNANTAPALAASSKENVNSLSYLQLSPSLGYHIHKKIAIGVGADVQRLLQANAPTTSSSAFSNGMASETGKIMPDLDYGIIGKTEYAVSSRLKAGLQYREGMNNFLSNTNKYFDRNYFQVQIKYSLFNK